MAEPIVYVDRSEVREGRLADLQSAMGELAAFIEANEPQLISYNVYYNEEETEQTVVHVHTDLSSLEFHMKTGGHLFPRMAEFLQLLRIDIYGEVDDDLLEELRKKAESLGGRTVSVHSLHVGFARFAGPGP